MNQGVTEAKDIDAADPTYGIKTRRLVELAFLGFNVPRFIAVSAPALTIWQDDLSQLAAEIGRLLPSASYAVRSSALSEDLADQSNAGQFCTCLNVGPEAIADALRTVIDDAALKLAGGLDSFSLLVQEFVPSERAGVVFTRGPAGGRELVIEEVRGCGDALVSGISRPETTHIYWNDPKVPAPFAALIAVCKQIERHYGFAQDIEWCSRNGLDYILQARPITTISDGDYQACLLLDCELPPGGTFLYQKGGISETAPQPTPITYSLLEKIYAADGPVAAAYSSLGITYTPTAFLKCFGIDLFCDTALEAQTIFPALQISPSGRRTYRLRGLLKTLRNISRLQTLPLDDYSALSARLKCALARTTAPASPDAALELFLSDYTLTFEINVRAQAAETALKRVLRKRTGTDPPSLAQLLSTTLPAHLTELLSVDLPECAELLGNSLEVADTSQFVSVDCAGTIDAANGAMLENEAQLAAVYSRLRELGRWLTVKNISGLRRAIRLHAHAIAERGEQLLYCLHLDELTGTFPPLEVLQNRLEGRRRLAQLSFPARISSELGAEHTSRAIQGISPGCAAGRLVTVDGLADFERRTGEQAILYTPILSPDLVGHFGSIAGIVSETGGTLSHLAIVARERGIPVVSNVSLRRFRLEIGSSVRIDGGRGTVERNSPEHELRFVRKTEICSSGIVACLVRGFDSHQRN